MKGLEFKLSVTKDRVDTTYAHGGMRKSQGAGKGLSHWSSYQFSVVSYKVLVPLAFPLIHTQRNTFKGVFGTLLQDRGNSVTFVSTGFKIHVTGFIVALAHFKGLFQTK